MRVYTAGLIEKSSPSSTANLRKRLLSHYRKRLRIPASATNSQRLNTFILLSAQRNDGNVDPTTMEQLEEGILSSFTKYHVRNKANFERELKHSQELRETARIVKDFVKEVDPSLAKVFESRLEQISNDIPNLYCQIQSKSIVTLWDLEETREQRIFLSGFDPPLFRNSIRETETNLDQLVDRFLFLNFFKGFLKPTVTRLHEMDQVLASLKSGVKGTHYQSKNQQLQTKLELFLRILTAKLSALNDLSSVINRILDLFHVPQTMLSAYHVENEAMNLDTALTELASEIADGRALLADVQDKLQECQVHLRDYLDEHKNGVKTVDSVRDFQTQLLPLAKLSIDLFVEAELLKTWTDLFGSDIPYFSFDRSLFDLNDTTVFDVADDTILAVRGLTKNYNLGKTTVYALRGVNLDVKEGEFVAILGNSGAGKTTLLNCMAGLDTPDHGVVLFRGKNLRALGDSAKSELRLLEMGFIFQSYTLLPHFNTRENVALPADLAGLSQNLKDRVEQLLKGVGIDQQAEQFPATLSGGQMQRVAIARALTNRPAVIFADEPTGDLDSVTGRQVMELLREFHEETGTTIVLITHEQDIADYAERQVLMEDGTIASTLALGRRSRSKTVEPRRPHQEVTGRKLRSSVKPLSIALAAQVAVATLVFALLLQIDQIVHVTLYSYGLQFDNTWALPYWAFIRSALGMLLLIIAVNGFLIVYMVRRQRRQ